MSASSTKCVLDLTFDRLSLMQFLFYMQKEVFTTGYFFFCKVLH